MLLLLLLLLVLVAVMVFIHLLHLRRALDTVHLTTVGTGRRSFRARSDGLLLRALHLPVDGTAVCCRRYLQRLSSVGHRRMGQAEADPVDLLITELGPPSTDKRFAEGLDSCFTEPFLEFAETASLFASQPCSRLSSDGAELATLGVSLSRVAAPVSGGGTRGDTLGGTVSAALLFTPVPALNGGVLEGDFLPTLATTLVADDAGGGGALRVSSSISSSASPDDASSTGSSLSTVFAGLLASRLEFRIPVAPVRLAAAAGDARCSSAVSRPPWPRPNTPPFTSSPASPRATSLPVFVLRSSVMRGAASGSGSGSESESRKFSRFRRSPPDRPVSGEASFSRLPPYGGCCFSSAAASSESNRRRLRSRSNVLLALPGLVGSLSCATRPRFRPPVVTVAVLRAASIATAAAAASSSSVCSSSLRECVLLRAGRSFSTRELAIGSGSGDTSRPRFFLLPDSPPAFRWDGGGCCEAAPLLSGPFCDAFSSFSWSDSSSGLGLTVGPPILPPPAGSSSFASIGMLLPSSSENEAVLEKNSGVQRRHSFSIARRARDRTMRSCCRSTSRQSMQISGWYTLKPPPRSILRYLMKESSCSASTMSGTTMPVSCEICCIERGSSFDPAPPPPDSSSARRRCSYR
uniref:Uncharacterized protein n=1 Tax=Anopheles melas TaxID=34690 RepID=A0A182TLF8_9DIPT